MLVAASGSLFRAEIEMMQRSPRLLMFDSRLPPPSDARVEESGLVADSISKGCT
jgi:hypothetical protein